MNGPLALPTLLGSTFSTANAARMPVSAPAFMPSQVELHRRMRFNPLRMVTPENLALAHDAFDLGHLWQGALFWDAMIRRDDTLSFVVPQLQNSIAAKPWGVFKRKNADPIEAARHAAALEYFYDHVVAIDAFDRNIRGDRHLLLKQMGLAYATRYAVHHFVWRQEPGKMIEVEGAAPVPALSAEMEFVPLWFFENTTGTLRLLRHGGFGGAGEDLDWDGEWMVTSGEGAMFAAASCYIFKRLTFQDWTVYNERYGQQKVIGMTTAQADSEAGRALTRIVNDFSGDMGIALHECQQTDKPPLSLLGPEGTANVDVFERFLDRQDEKMSVLFRGSAQANVASKDNEHGITAQIKETEALEIAHCANIASACRTFIDRAVIRACFGEGIEPLAWFGLPDMDDEDAQQLRENAGFIADRGGRVDLPNVADRLGVPLADETADEADVLQPIGGTANAESSTPNAEGEARTANSRKLARLQQLVEAALRTANAPFDPAKHPRGEHGRFGQGVTLTGEEFGANLDIHALRVKAREHLNGLRGTFVVNDQTQTPILIDRKGAREAVSNFRQPEELQAVAGIEQMIARASYVGSAPDADGKPDIKAWHEYEVPVQIAGQAYQFTIKVRELRDGHRFYDSFSKKSGPGAESGTTSKTLGGPKAPSPAP